MKEKKTWLAVVSPKEVPVMGSRVLFHKKDEIVLFKTKDEKIHAISNICPHKQGKLSEGLVHGNKVTCPLHNWDIDLDSGEAKGNDCACTSTYETKIENQMLYIKL